MLSEILDWHDSRELEISHSKPGSEWNAKSWIFCWWKGRSRKVKDSCWHVAMKHYCQTKLCRWCDSPPSPPNGGHPKYYVAIMNEQFQMSLSHSYGCSWNLQQGKFAEFNSEFLIQFMTLHSTPIPRLERESKFIFIFLASKWNMACLWEGELYAGMTTAATTQQPRLKCQ